MNQSIYLPDYTDFGDITYAPGGTYGPRVQQKLQLVMMYSGDVTVWIDQQPHHYERDTVFILFPGHREFFEFSKTTETHHGWVDLVSATLPTAIIQKLKTLPASLPLSSEMKQLVCLGRSLQYGHLSTNWMMVRLMAAQALWLYIGEGEQKQSSAIDPKLNPIMRSAQRYIDLNLHHELTLDWLAKEIAVSPGHLIRLFKLAYNQTPMEYVWQRRVSVGIDLLKSSGFSVSFIAQRCGFKTSKHFSRRVRAATGCSPLEFRYRSWAGETLETRSKAQAL